LTRSRRPPARKRDGALAFWTIQRATVAGVAGGVAALLLSSLTGSWVEPLLGIYAGLLAFTAFCGVSILWITLLDIRNRGRGGRMRPIRAFDVAAGLALILPSAYALWLVWPELGL
jgi:hypothetical protein